MMDKTTSSSDGEQRSLHYAVTVFMNPVTHAYWAVTDYDSSGEDFCAETETSQGHVTLVNQDSGWNDAMQQQWTSGENWSWGEWKQELVTENKTDYSPAQNGSYVVGDVLDATRYQAVLNGAAAYDLRTPDNALGYAQAFISQSGGSAYSQMDGTARLQVHLGGGSGTWSGSFCLADASQVNTLNIDVPTTSITANGHLQGSPSSYVYNGTDLAGNLCVASLSGNLVGTGSGTTPVTGAIGAGQFVHADDTQVALVYGTDLQ